MKKQTELRKILRIYFLCVVVSLSIMFALMGFFRARSNSEYALNGKKPEHITAPFFNALNVNIFQS